MTRPLTVSPYGYTLTTKQMMMVPLMTPLTTALSTPLTSPSVTPPLIPNTPPTPLLQTSHTMGHQSKTIYWSDPKTLFMICVFYAQTVWPSTLTHKRFASNFYSQTVWPPTKPVTQLGEVGCKIDFAKKMKTTMVGPFTQSIGMTIELITARGSIIGRG